MPDKAPGLGGSYRFTTYPPCPNMRRSDMAEPATKLPVGKEQRGTDRPAEWRPFESLRRGGDRLFEDFPLGSRRSPFGGSLFDVQPFWRGGGGWGQAPAGGLVGKGKGYELTAGTPGMKEGTIDG